MYMQQFFIDGLGCASYLVGCEEAGVAAVVDPDREVGKYIDAAKARGLKVTHIIETHLHADHVSGNTELAHRTGAQIYLHEAARAEFKHQPLKDGDILELGGVRLAVRHTPGHTPESITLLVSDTNRAEAPWMALTGDLLFVGDVGRPDLVGIEAARGMAGDLHDSLFGKVLPLDDGLMIYPGHGSGSLCGRNIGSVRSTTLGYERRFNPALGVEEKDAFVDYMTSNLPEQPGNHRNIKALNRRGPARLGEVRLKALTVDQAVPHFQRGAALLDLRPKDIYTQKHVPGSVHLEADSQLSNKIGFVLDPQQPIVLLLNDRADYEAVVYNLGRVGYEQVLGYLAEGLPGWEQAGLQVTSGDTQNVNARELDELIRNGNDSRPVVVDVREPWEHAMGHIPDTLLMPLGQLAQRVKELDAERPVAVVCASGNRSQSAALLGQKGFKKVYNLIGGMHAWQQAGLATARNGRN